MMKNRWCKTFIYYWKRR